MDFSESKEALQKPSLGNTKRLPLVPADNKNGANRQARAREVNIRYRSPTPFESAAPKRCPSPNASWLSPATTMAAKRAASTERKRLSRPSSPQTLSTPIKDASAEMLRTSRKIVGNRLPESIWPSTMRSLSVSFQSDSLPLPTSKREKPVSHVRSDRTLRPSPIVSAARNSTPERKRNLLKGKNSVDQSENSTAVDSLHPRLVDQHRWTSKTSGKVSTTDRSIDLSDKTRKNLHASCSKTATRSLSRLSPDGKVKPLQKPKSDFPLLVSRYKEDGRATGGCLDGGSSQQMQNLRCLSSSNTTQLINAAARALSLPLPGSCPASPSVSRRVSPARTNAVNSPSRGPSPARVRPGSPFKQPKNTTSVLSFIVDIKKGKQTANHIEDVHQLRLLYNRHLQWRYANARTNAALQSWKLKAMKMLHGVWKTISHIRDSMVEKRIDLQQLKLMLNLYSILNNQLNCLNEWASIESDHCNSLTWAIHDLQSSTIRVPFTGGANGDIEAMKAAVCSAVDVMQAMISLCSVLSRVERMNCLLSELAEVASQERAMLDECESFLCSIASLQTAEQSNMTYILQTKQG